MPRTPLIKDEPLLAALVELAVLEASRQQLRDDPEAFRIAKGLNAAQFAVLQSGNFATAHAAVVNVETTIP